ncbi:MAG: GGDEF domain-containing protein [Deltaproteobacteria bacterium]|nr:GGDEF domain-containing protein [Deltaproteobacteria bacterium]
MKKISKKSLLTKKSPKKTLKAPQDLAFPMHLTENQIIDELRQTVEKLRIFDSLGKTLTSSLDLSEVLKIVVEKLGHLVNCQHFALVFLDEASNEFFYEFPKEIADKKNSFTLGRGILGRCLERGKGELFLNPKKDPLFDAEVDALVSKNPTSLIVLPIMSRGSVLGLIAFFTEKNEKVFSIEQFRLLETFSDYLAIAVENARNFKHVQELTVTDDLTKLYNSRYLHLVLERELARGERYKEALSVVFIDIDNFKKVNDQHGHMVGSQLLKEFGEFFLSLVRLSDVAIRYGGDEFVLVLPKTTKKEAVTFVERALDTLHSHVFLKTKHLNIKATASFGIATFPEDGKTIDQIISAADKAMYYVKKGNKDGVYAAAHPITLIGTGSKI